MNTTVTFGLQLTIRGQAPVDSWFESRSARDDAVQALRTDYRRIASNVNVRVDNLLRLDDGSIHAERGEPALHVQWRRSAVRTEHKSLHAYRMQDALVDVVSGRVVIIDKREPFSVAQYQVWSKAAYLVDGAIEGFADRWLRLLPMPHNPEGHYLVKRVEDLLALQQATSSPTS